MTPYHSPAFVAAWLRAKLRAAFWSLLAFAWVACTLTSLVWQVTR